MKTLERIFWILLLIGVIAFFLTRPKAGEKVIVERDTVTIWDTVTIDHPVPVYRTIRDSILVPITDTLLITRNDTLWATLPREEVTYSDSLYKAVITGYQPVLETIEIYSPVKTITIHEKEKASRWSLGAQAGYGVTKSGLSPYVGVGISYRIF